MPEMDVAWQRTRNVIPTFQEKARAAGATSVKGFAQALLLATNGGNAGICYGMSCAWILAKAKGDNSAIDQGFLSAAAGNRDAFYRNTSGDLHNSQYSRHQAEDGLHHVRADHFVKAGLHLRQTRNFDDRFYRMRKAAQFITANAGYHMVNTPNHAMAASSIGGVYSFFDPNLGEANFNNSGQFQTFFENWMSSDLIVKAYRGRKGGRLNDGGAHRTLHLSIDYYA